MKTSLFNCNYFVNMYSQVFMKKQGLIDAIKQQYPNALLYQRDSELKIVLKINDKLETQFICRMICNTMGHQFFVNDLQVATHLKLNQYTLNNFHFYGKGARNPDIAWKFADDFIRAIGLDVDEHHDIMEKDGDEYDYTTQKNFD